MSDLTRFILNETDLPKQWYNVLADSPVPPQPVLHPGTQACRVLVVTDRLDLEDQLARNFMNSGAFGSALATG